MHFQRDVADWPSVLPHLPARALIKAVDRPDILRQAKQLRPDCITFLRHFNIQSAPRNADWQGALNHWRRMFARFVDGTYLRDYAQFVDLVGDANEYTAASTWSDPDRGAWAIQSMRAAATVWNSEYRGRKVYSADGGEGFIPATCKFALMAGPVSNRFPRSVLELGKEMDCPVDYHAYSLWSNGLRYPRDWQEHSGLWAMLEAEYGVKPEWVFGEVGPYAGVSEGWRHATVLNGNDSLLVEAMRQWVVDIASTPAYREGRVLGPGAWYTIGQVGWEFYQLGVPDLIAIADAVAPLWHPGESMTSKAKLLLVLGTEDAPNELAPLIQHITADINYWTEHGELPPAVPWWQTLKKDDLVISKRPGGAPVWTLRPEPLSGFMRWVFRGVEMNATWTMKLTADALPALPMLKVSDGNINIPPLWVSVNDVEAA